MPHKFFRQQRFNLSIDSSMGKFTVIGMVCLLVFAATLILVDSQLNINNNSQQPSNGSHEPQNGGTSGFVALQVEGYVVDDFWERGSNDLPAFNVAINYVVENVGNTSADVVSIEITLDSAYYSTEAVYNLSPNSTFTDTFSVSVEYDQAKTVGIKANCGNATASWSYIVDAELPRQPSWSVSKLFVTPNEYYVQSTYKKIMSGIVFVHWIAIRDWVGKNVKYVDDYDSYSVGEFWQLGKETLERRTGDCEDFAILLCSLLRADGWSAEEVYVVIGQNEVGDYHAWVKIKIPFVGWYNIEPQLNGWNTLFGDFIALNGYTAVYNFNDQYFIGL